MDTNLHVFSPRGRRLATLLLASAASWFSAAAADFASVSIAALDQNRDGAVSATEYVNWQIGNMARFDSDQTPGLSAEEFRRSLDEPAQANAGVAFNSTDRNRDGVLDEAEFGGYHHWVFSHVLDTNSDGRWTEIEYREFLNANPGLGAERLATAMIKGRDQDHDGTVSLREYLQSQAPKFRTSDTSGNGALSRSEFKASLDERGRRRAAASFKAFDFDGDRKLNRQEFFDYHGFVFNKVLDLNRDGEWSVDEARTLLD
jgi:Ca2+-binding EF-hand superfamily protein